MKTERQIDLEEVLALVQRCAEEVAEQQDIELSVALTADTPLFGREGVLDSLGVVSLVVAVEEAIADKFSLTVSLADERAMSQKRSPFRTVGSLAEYARDLMGEAN